DAKATPTLKVLGTLSHKHRNESINGFKSPNDVPPRTFTQPPQGGCFFCGRFQDAFRALIGAAFFRTSPRRSAISGWYAATWPRPSVARLRHPGPRLMRSWAAAFNAD